MIEINDEMQQQSFPSPSYEFNWLAQLVWGQQLALELAKKLGTNPDTVRKDQSVFVDANKYIHLQMNKIKNIPYNNEEFRYGSQTHHS